MKALAYFDRLLLKIAVRLGPYGRTADDELARRRVAKRLRRTK